MKRRVYSFLIFLFTLAFCFRLNGQPAEGDYRSHQSGLWNVADSWEKYSGGVWVYPATEYPPLGTPYIRTRVTIQNGHTITATANVSGYTSSAVLEVVEGGTLEMGSYAVMGRSSSYYFQTVIINGTLNTAGHVTSVSFTLGNNGKFVSSYSDARGWWYSGLSPTSVSLLGEVVLTGTSQPIPAYSYNILVVSGGDKIPAGNFTINGSLTIAPGCNLVLAGAILTSKGTGIIINGQLNANTSFIKFDGGTQTISGTGSIGGLLRGLTIGELLTTDVSIANPNIITANEVIISPDCALSLNPDSKLTVMGFIDTSDGLLLQASTSAPYTCATLIIDPLAEVFGNINSEIFLTGGGSSFLGNYKWHYISSPFTSLDTAVFTTITKNLVQFIESRPSTSLMQGWVTYRGYSYSDGVYTGIKFGNLNPGQGYDFYDNVNNTLVFTGTPNISDVTVPIGFSGIPENVHGFNLLGNPFTSGLNWDLIADDPSYPLNTSKAINFTRDNQQCSYVNGVGIPSDATGIIPPMQGFFIRTTSTGNSINLAASARTHNNIHQRYKGLPEIPLIRLALSETTDPNDETVVRFDEDAKTYLDNDFDAVKMFLASDKTTIHTTSEGTNFSINGLPTPADGSVTEVPIVVNLTSDGVHKISASQIQFLDNFNVFLKDNTTGISTDLKTIPEVSFSAPSGNSTRFVLRIANVLTGIEDPFFSPEAFSIYNGYGYITILPLVDAWNGLIGSVKVFDITGKTIVNMPQTEFNKNTPILIKSPDSSGLFIVELKSGILRYTRKVVVN